MGIADSNLENSYQNIESMHALKSLIFGTQMPNWNSHGKQDSLDWEYV